MNGAMSTLLTLQTQGKLVPKAFCTEYRRYISATDEDMDSEITNKMLKQGPCHSDEGSDQESQKDEHTKISERFIGIRDVPFSRLREPDGPLRGYQVRAVNQARVEELYNMFTQRKQSELSSTLTVMELSDEQEGEQAEYLIIDGNHRYRAMSEVRKNTNSPPAFNTVPCLVYREMTTVQVLATGFTRNTEAADVYKMTDFDSVEVIRKILTRYESDPNVLDKVHSIMGCDKKNDGDKSETVSVSVTVILVRYCIM